MKTEITPILFKNEMVGRITYPSKGLADKSFTYINADNTNLAATNRRVFDSMAGMVRKVERVRP